MFKKYQHIEKFGRSDVEGIDLGKCYIFPKLDGTNSSIWIEGKLDIKAGSRRRKLSLDNDNADFYNAVLNQVQFKGVINCLKDNPNLRFFGEWLVPHTLKDYRENAWRKFYVFDVIEHLGEESFRYLPYEEYKKLCDLYKIEYIPPLKIIKNPTYEDLLYVAENNHYLLPEDKVGEGVVIKNYDYTNKYGRIVWAKIVLSEFKEKHYKEMGSPEKENKMIEEEYVEKYCTKTFIEKTYAKIANEKGEFNSRDIPHLLNLCFKDLVEENIWDALKKFKNPIINYKTLKHFTIIKIKKVKPELF